MTKVRSVMEQKFLRDYFDADEIDNKIIKKEIYLSVGVEILTNLIKKILTDIRLLDIEKFNSLSEKITEIKERTKKEKQQEKETYEQNTGDSYDQEIHRVKLANIEHEGLQDMLEFISEIGYHKGWLE